MNNHIIFILFLIVKRYLFIVLIVKRYLFIVYNIKAYKYTFLYNIIITNINTYYILYINLYNITINIHPITLIEIYEIFYIKN